jgi:hypothetical protein
MIQVHLCLVCAWTTAVQAAAGLRPGAPGHGRGDEPGREAESRSYQDRGHCGTPVLSSLRSSPTRSGGAAAGCGAQARGLALLAATVAPRPMSRSYGPRTSS